MKKCAFCNAEIEDNAKKCDYCEQECDPILELNTEIKPAPVVRKRRKNPWWAVVLSVFLAFGIFFSAAFGTGFVLLRQAISSATIETVVKDVDIFSIPIDDGTVLDKVEEVFKESGNEYLENMTTEDIQRIAEEAGLQDALSDIMGQVSDLMTGKTTEIDISAEQLMVLVEDNLDLIEETTGYRLTEDDLDSLETVLTEQTEAITKEINEQAAVLLEQPAVKTTMTTVKIAISPAIPIAAFVVTGLCVLFVLLLLRRKEGTFMYAGIPALILAIILGVIYGGAEVIKAYALAMISVPDTILAMVDSIIAAVLNPVMYAAIICGAVGIVCIILFIVLKICIGKSKKYAK